MAPQFLKHPKRPDVVVGNAARVMQTATGEREEEYKHEPRCVPKSRTTAYR